MHRGRTRRILFGLVMFLIVFDSLLLVQIDVAKASDVVPYDNIGIEWNRNSALVKSDGCWDSRIWQWNMGTSDLLYHNDASNYIKWYKDGLVESSSQDGTDPLWKCTEFNQGNVRYENEIYDLDEFAWSNKTSSLMVDGSVTLFEGIGYTGQSITFASDVSDLRLYGWNDRASSLTLAKGLCVTLFEGVGYGGGIITFQYPSYQPPDLRVSDKSSITLEGVVSNWHTSTGTFPGWTGVKFDVFAVENRYSHADRVLMLEMYIVRDGGNLAWQLLGGSSIDLFRHDNPNSYNYLVALDGFPQFAEREVYPGNFTRWKVDVKAFIQAACNHFSELDISKLSIVKIGFTIESAYFIPSLIFSPSAGCSLTRLRLAYTEAPTVYLENAYNKPQSGNSWLKVNDLSSTSGAVMEATASSTNGGTLFGPYITNGCDGSSMAGKPYTAIFRLKVSSNSYSNNVAYLDIAYNKGVTIRSMVIRADDFASPDTWQTFDLPFVTPDNLAFGLEFRVIDLNEKIADLFIDNITVQRDWSSSTVYFQGAISKPQSGSSWSQVGEPSSSYGAVMMASKDAPNGGCLYGPYISKDMGGGAMNGEPYVATFRLKITSNTSSNVVVYVDVAFNLGIVLESKQIRANDFASPNRWQDFQITFAAPDNLTQGLEFRVINLNMGTTDVFVDRISVSKDSSVVYSQSASSKPHSGGAWSKSYDPAALSDTVMVAYSYSPNWDVLYGPYIMADSYGSSLLGMSYIAVFRMKVSSDVQKDNVVYIDICYDQGTTIFKQAFVKASDFAGSNAWQNFQLAFTVPSSLRQGLEFRLQNMNHGTGADIYVDRITVCKDWNASTIYVESAYNKLQYGNSWARVPDSSSLSGLVMKATNSSQNGGWLFGPYITKGWDEVGLANKQCTVIFQLKVSSNLSTSNVAYVDVAYNRGSVLQSTMIKASDFKSADTWQGFQLTFTVPENLAYGVEFRIQNLNSARVDLYVDRIIVF